MLTRRGLLLTAGALGVAALARAEGAPRVLVLGGDLAEIVFAIGAGELVIATDTSALWPPEAEALPKVGYMRQLSAEGILSLMPDLVLSAVYGAPITVERGRNRVLGVAPDFSGAEVRA